MCKIRAICSLLVRNTKKRQDMYSRTSKLFTAAVLACTAAISMVSCDNDNQSYYLVNTGYNALVTVKTAEGGGSYLQLDDETTLNPVNVSGTLFGGKEKKNKDFQRNMLSRKEKKSKPISSFPRLTLYCFSYGWKLGNE